MLLSEDLLSKYNKAGAVLLDRAFVYSLRCNISIFDAIEQITALLSDEGDIGTLKIEAYEPLVISMWNVDMTAHFLSLSDETTRWVSTANQISAQRGYYVKYLMTRVQQIKLSRPDVYLPT